MEGARELGEKTPRSHWSNFLIVVINNPEMQRPSRKGEERRAEPENDHKGRSPGA